MNEMTKDFFLEIGITKGMTVLDVGCGRGVTTEMIADIVGEKGKVIGVDANPKSINVAQESAQLQGLQNIEYICTDLSDLALAPASLDAVLGRRVLVYIPERKEVIAKLTTFLKPGGIIGFQEHDSTAIINKELMPTHAKAHQWVWQLVAQNGGEINIGKQIWDVFSHAGLIIEKIHPEAVVQTPQNEESLESLVQMLSPLLLAQKIVQEKELHEVLVHLASEKKTANCIFVRELIIFVSARKK